MRADSESRESMGWSKTAMNYMLRDFRRWLTDEKLEQHRHTKRARALLRLQIQIGLMPQVCNS